VSHSDSGRMPLRHLHHPTRTRGVRVTTGSSIRLSKVSDESCPSCHTDVDTEKGERESRMLLANLNHRVSRECVLSGDCELGSAQSRTGCNVKRAATIQATHSSHHGRRRRLGMASAWWEVLHACVAGRVAECPCCLCLHACASIVHEHWCPALHA
jgi:hypothetical protein